jgi:hypothetical protein
VRSLTGERKRKIARKRAGAGESTVTKDRSPRTRAYPAAAASPSSAARAISTELPALGTTSFRAWIAMSATSRATKSR